MMMVLLITVGALGVAVIGCALLGPAEPTSERGDRRWDD